MRFLTRQIHRAFPELDSYDDEQCGRFIKAARSGALVWFVHTTLILAVTLPLLVVGIGLSAWASEKFQIYSFSRQSFALWLSIALWMIANVFFLGFGLVAGYLTRDLLLRRRLRYVLRTRGGCPGCGYSVIGLAVTLTESGASAVRCPECGLEVEVDPSLAELVREDLGTSPHGAREHALGVAGATGRVFLGGQRVDISVFWTPKRKRLLKRTAIILAIVVFGGGGLVAGINELFIRWQAAAAKRTIDKAQADYLALAERGYAAAGIGKDVQFLGPSVWEQFDEMSHRIESVDDATWHSPANAGTDLVFPDFTSITNPAVTLQSATTPEEAAKAQAAIDLARSLIPQYSRNQVFVPLADIAANPNARLPVSMLSVEVAKFDFSMMGRQRALCRVLAGRLALAAESGDRDAFLETLRAILAMARAFQVQPQPISNFVGIAFDSLANEQLRDMLLQHRIRPEWIPAIQDILKQHRRPIDFAHAHAGERLITTTTIAQVFADPANARFGRFSPGFRQILGSGWGTLSSKPWTIRLGTLTENLAVINTMFDSTAPQVGLESWQRGTAPAITFPQTNLGLVLVSMGSLNQHSQTVDLAQANRRGIDTWLALERFRDETGAYPAALAELIPNYLPALPLDPWTANPILYKRFATGEDPNARPFVLYFAGPDGIDDGGIGAVKGQSFWSQTKDHVVNDPDR